MLRVLYQRNYFLALYNETFRNYVTFRVCSFMQPEWPSANSQRAIQSNIQMRRTCKRLILLGSFAAKQNYLHFRQTVESCRQ